MRPAEAPNATAPHARQTDDMHSTDPYYSDSQVTSWRGRALDGARVLPCGAAHHVVTSPAMVRGGPRDPVRNPRASGVWPENTTAHALRLP